MSNKWHSKWHRHNHHTDPTAGSVDSSYDPIASQNDPFKGNFYLDGTLSANGVITDGLTGSSAFFTDLSADTITVTTLNAATAFIDVTDMKISELSGFSVVGNDYNLNVPATIDPDTEPLVFLDGIGLSGTSWAAFNGDLALGRGLSAQRYAQGPINLGYNSVATGESSYAEGYGSSATNRYTHAEGLNTSSSGFVSHAEGNGTVASQAGSHAEGGTTVADGNFSHAEGLSTNAHGPESHAENWLTVAFGDVSHAEGQVTLAHGNISHAEGFWTAASGIASHSEGSYTSAVGYVSHSQGISSIASGRASFAAGEGTIASGDYSTSLGFCTTASASYSYAEGSNTLASGQYAHAAGRAAVAKDAQSYVWSSYVTEVSSSATDQFTVSAENGVRLGSSVELWNPTAIGDLTVNGNISASGNLSANDAHFSSSSVWIGNQRMSSDNDGIIFNGNTTALSGTLDKLTVGSFPAGVVIDPDGGAKFTESISKSVEIFTGGDVMYFDLGEDSHAYIGNDLKEAAGFIYDDGSGNENGVLLASPSYAIDVTAGNSRFNDVSAVSAAFTGDLTVQGNISCDGDIILTGSTIVNSVTSTGEFLTLTVNGSALAIPLYLY